MFVTKAHLVDNRENYVFVPKGQTEIPVFSFIISVNFTLFKSLKVDGRNKILNFFKWLFGILSIQKDYKSVCTLKVGLEMGEMVKAIFFYSIVVGMGNLK